LRPFFVPPADSGDPIPEKWTYPFCGNGGRLPTFKGRGDRVDGQEHRQWFTWQQALAHTLDVHKAERLVKAHSAVSIGRGVGQDSDAADAATLFDRQGQHVARQCLADTQAPGSRIYAQAGQT
jgi:hypothetical protein